VLAEPRAGDIQRREIRVAAGDRERQAEGDRRRAGVLLDDRQLEAFRLVAPDRRQIGDARQQVAALDANKSV
jgi:hypothetical protein